ncbi:uncharacterized protein KD926_003059 [Aspergillus affinis]|uniref:uncharacterized protein n=1 Tax=Aspergillus affinis TaxID=1070780 RepID=UPI0022FE76B8|nr:uncharacterized protein KD926_003059 [Aspergillus affinis]KAI9043709.1 hypothetical protein KD926_003059 [Aspergillus affinis]
MPLHLLGKKSWNVYNPENIARVRRDEAQAKAREEEQERLMQEEDAERRIQVLRGEKPSTPPPPPRLPSPTSRSERKSHTDHIGRSRKRRRLAGENDTDRDIRFAREDAQFTLAKREELASSRTSDAPLEDSAGHINLFPSNESKRPVEKNAEAEKESANKQRSYEDQYTMRFSNAAGFRQSVGQKPWYSSSGTDAMAPESVSGKDVWGNEDPMRKEREKSRMDANDPLAAQRKTDPGTAGEDRDQKTALRDSGLMHPRKDAARIGIESHIGTTDMVEIGVEIGHIRADITPTPALIGMVAITAAVGMNIDIATDFDCNLKQ